jgi:hypothetical protein
VESLAATAARVEALARRLGAEGLSRSYGPGKWTGIRSLTSDDLDREALHPERGPEKLGTIVRLLAGHDFNHLAQLERL